MLVLSLLPVGGTETITAAPSHADAGSLPPAPVWRTGAWEPAALGNHRAVLSVAAPASAVRARILWRRHDANPAAKDVVIIAAATGETVTNVLRLRFDEALGDLVFPAPVAGTYYAYYLPSVSRGKNYPTSSYQKPARQADVTWLAACGLDTPEHVAATLPGLPAAQVVALEAVDDFNRFDPMELSATAEEQAQLVTAHSGEAFLLFPEDRMNPIRMPGSLPSQWIASGPRAQFAGQAAPGEFYSFQLGLFALTNLTGVKVAFEDLRSADGGRVIPASALRCINTGGTNWCGEAFTKSVAVNAGRVQALWCGVPVPDELTAGTFTGQVTVSADGYPPKPVLLTLTVSGPPLADHGDSQPAKQSRLRWLDSTLAQDEDVTKPFIPLTRTGDTVHILGRDVSVGPMGLPRQILSHFTPEGTLGEGPGTNLLSAPVELVVETADGARLEWTNPVCQFTRTTGGTAEWSATGEAGPLRLTVRGRMEYDGFVSYQADVTAMAAVDLADARLELPVAQNQARYFMGLGVQGSRRPTVLDWKWNVKLHQDSAWIGDTDAGLRFELKGENYDRPLLTNFYEDKPLNLPPAWFNGGLGGVTLRETNGAALVRCYGGPRRLEREQTLHFDFELLLTPFKPVNTREHWANRYFHSYQPPETVIAAGANTINLHHASDPNPYINYPFLHAGVMRDYVAAAHAKNLKVKIYYTIRELSNHTLELPALLSLGDEVFPGGKGGGDAWLQEHVGTNYLPGWYVGEWHDAALINKGGTRWDNYYVEGLQWLVQNVGIDGLYIDDLAYDRITMKRVRKVLDRGRPEALIDFHSANQYDPNDGFGSCANVYMEVFPYIDRLWYGEYFKPDSGPDFWLLEMSGLPYGLMGEMLQDGGNRWRGMLYGMTSRIPYQGHDPSPIWHLWDSFKIQDSRMIGYWSPNCPVHTDDTNILATAYVKPGKTLISLASWAPKEQSVRLTFDWAALGIDPARAVLLAPAVDEFQPAAKFRPDQSIPVPAGKGWLLYVTQE